MERLIRIYNRLRRGPVTIEIIKHWTDSVGIEVSSRQLYRDLITLQNLQIAEGENVVEFVDEKNRKTWKLEYEDGLANISQYDINSFFLLKNFAPATIVQQRQASINKFEQIIYKAFSKSKYQQFIQANELYLHRTNFFAQLYDEAEHQLIEDYIWALHNNRMIVIESIGINSANMHVTESDFPLDLAPMQLVFHRGRTYMAGFNNMEKLIIFPIDRNTRFHLTNTKFNRKNLTETFHEKMGLLFGISDPIDDQVYDIEIEYTKAYGESWMRYFWHQSQQWRQLENGNYMLHLHCSIGRELVGFLGYGLDKIKVHRPQLLKEMLVEKAQRMVDLHEQDLPIDEQEANKMY